MTPQRPSFSTRAEPAGSPPEQPADAGRSPVVPRFLAVSAQLALILLTNHLFQIEPNLPFLPVLCLAVGGFLVHAWLPRSWRAAFFALLSLLSILLVLGWPNGAWVIGIGTGLIALCHLPLPLLVRVLLLIVAGAQLALLRLQFPQPFWPVLASMFMFRLIVYLYEVGWSRQRPPLAHILAYFFPLPNICFPLFPVLDFQTFRTTYYDDDDYAIYQRGIAALVRGLSHLLLYRVVKYYLLPAPHHLTDLPHLLLFLAANYALYLRVSGWFHTITGMLHLFGFNLPRTNFNYFLASSFSDIWRRINIYWKDFMAKIFFVPVFFRLQRWGKLAAVTGASLCAFVATWLLHSYQVFWLVGDVSLTANDAMLWLAAGVLVTVNLQLDLRRARKGAFPRRGDERERGRLSASLKGSGGFDPWGAAILSLKTIGMFALISFFWGCWTLTLSSLVSFLHVPTAFSGSAGAAGVALLAGLAGAVSIGVLVQLIRHRLYRRSLLPLRLSFQRSVLVHAVALTLLVGLGLPQLTGVLGSQAADVAATLRQDAQTPLEVAQVVRGYYEEIAEAPRQAGPWFGLLTPEKKSLPDDQVHYTEMTRPANDDYLPRELIPGWSGNLAGSRLTINRLGMRDREDITPHKQAGTCRIALVGSSIVMGYGVADDQVFKCLLEDDLNAAVPPDGPRYELLNFGTGLSDAISRRALIEQKVFGFEPDAIYYFAHQDEFYNPPRLLAKLLAQGQPLRYPALTEAVRKANLTPDMPGGVVEARLRSQGKEMVLGLYRGLVAECRERGILPVWVYIPMPGIVKIKADTTEMVSVATQAGFTTVNLADWSDGYTPAEVKLYGRDYHANALGHQLIAARLFADMRQRLELLPAFARLHR